MYVTHPDSSTSRLSLDVSSAHRNDLLVRSLSGHGYTMSLPSSSVITHTYGFDKCITTHMYPMAEFLREKSLRWFGHVQRREKDEAKDDIKKKKKRYGFI